MVIKKVVVLLDFKMSETKYHRTNFSNENGFDSTPPKGVHANLISIQKFQYRSSGAAVNVIDHEVINICKSYLFDIVNC